MTEEVFVDDPGLESAPHTSEDETEEVNRLTKETEETETKESEETEEAETDEETEDADDTGDDAAARDKVETEAQKLAKRYSQKRINEMTREKKDIERERDALKRAMEMVTQGQVPQQQQQQQQVAKPPRRYDFSTDEEFDAAQTRYVEQRASEIAREQFQQLQREQQQTEAQRQQEQTLQQVQQAETEFASEHDDYFDSVDTITAVDPDAVRNVLPAEDAPKVLYHLSKHPDEAQKIAQLPTTEQAVYALGRINASLSQEPRQKTTKAPNPPKTVKGQGKSSRKWRDDMPMSEVEKRLGYK